MAGQMCKISLSSGIFKEKLIWPHSESGPYSVKKVFLKPKDNDGSFVSAWQNSFWASFESLILPFKCVIFPWK